MKRKKIIIIAAGILCVAMWAITCGAGVYAFKEATCITSNDSTSLNRDKSLKAYHVDMSQFKKDYIIEQIEIKSTLDGHMIPADFISMEGNQRGGIAILVHGLKGNRISTYPAADIFLRQGYNVIAYDQRASGENTAKYNTFGYLESKDLLDCLDYAEGLAGKEGKIILFGISVGGATVGFTLGEEGIEDKVDYAILDCPVSNMNYMISTRIGKKTNILPTGYFMFAGDIALRIKLGFSFDDADVCKYIADTGVPLLILNSKADGVTPYFMGEDIYNAIKNDKKRIFTVTDSGHADIQKDYPNEYRDQIVTFIQ